MTTTHRRARRYYQCECCLQLIEPGEVYACLRWMPWEAEGHYAHAKTCRWCAASYGKWVLDGPDLCWQPRTDRSDWIQDQMEHFVGRLFGMPMHSGATLRKLREPLLEAQQAAWDLFHEVVL